MNMLTLTGARTRLCADVISNNSGHAF